jgi:transposase
MRICGLDVAKRVFQIYWVDSQTGEIVNRRFGREELIRFLAQRPAGRVALEACGSGHWWARKIKALGHEVVLLHAQFIRPFVQTNKTDAADARAIWTAVQLHSWDWCHGKAAPGARSDWDRSQSAVTRTCARC